MKNPVLWLALTALFAIASFLAVQTIGFVAPLVLTTAAVGSSLTGIVITLRDRQRAA